MNEQNIPQWQFLAPGSHTWRTQLYVKGRHLPASAVWTTMTANGLAIEQAADNWDLPVKAIEEIVRYCEQNKLLLEKEAEHELRLLKEKGIDIEQQ